MVAILNVILLIVFSILALTLIATGIWGVMLWFGKKYGHRESYRDYFKNMLLGIFSGLVVVAADLVIEQIHNSSSLVVDAALWIMFAVCCVFLLIIGGVVYFSLTPQETTGHSPKKY
jgi:hypothetical protein